MEIHKKKQKEEGEDGSICDELDLQNSIAMASPIPEEAPTTHTVFPA
jgi:hypothetical protein